MEHWTKQDIKFLLDNYKTKSYHDISKTLNRTESAIRAKCFDLNLIKNNRWTESEVSYLIENYNRLNTKELSKHLNRTESAVQIKIKKLGLKKSLTHYNRRFFNNIKSEDQAYWLGFIAADGWIESKKNHSATIGIELQYSDIEHLRKFNKCLDGNVEVKKRMSNKSRICDRIIDSFPMCYIKLHSREMALDLEYYGIYPKKSFDIKFPNNLEDHLIHHFIRGYFDGNGSISASKHKNGQYYIKCDFSCYSSEMLVGLREHLYKYGIKSYISEKSHRLYIGGLENTDHFLKYIYKDASIFLERKYQKQQLLYEKYNILERLPHLPEMVG